MAKKPEITDAPEWATYIIKDDGGQWYWCENKPTIIDGFIDHVGQMEFCNTDLDDETHKEIKIK